LAEARLRADAGIAPGAPDDADAGPSLGAVGGAEQRGPRGHGARGRTAGARNVAAPDARGRGVHGRSERLALLRDLRAGRITVDEALRELRDA